MDDSWMLAFTPESILVAGLAMYITVACFFGYMMMSDSSDSRNHNYEADFPEDEGEEEELENLIKLN